MEDPTSDINDWEVVVQEEDGNFTTKVSSSSITSAIIPELAADEGGVIQSDYFTLYPHHQLNNINNNSYVGDGDTAGAAAVVSQSSPIWVDPGGSRKRSRSPDSKSSSSESSSIDQDDLLSSIEPNDLNILNELGMSSGSQFFIEEFHDAPEAEEEFHGVVVFAEDNEVSRLRSEEKRGSESKIERLEKEEKRVVWWKVPMEVLRYCVMRVSPVWSLSVAAAAVMGMLILRRRYLVKLKRKAQGIQLKVTADDKKVSQFMARATRLNEAFTVVKRVPIIRPALPAPGMVPWPVVSMR